MPDLNIVYQAIDDLKPLARNARTHSKKQLDKIADSIKRYGFTNPVLVDDNNTVLAGNGRVAAATTLGITRIPTIRLNQMTEDEKRAYILADNKLAELAGWDKEILAIELEYLISTDLDVAITGFQMGEIDFLIQSQLTINNEQSKKAAEELPAFCEQRCSPGDLWQAGDHFIFCGDSLKEISYQQLLGEQRAEMVITDPPYNVKINGHVSGNGAVQHREFSMGSGEMSPDEFTTFLKSSFEMMARYSQEGSIHYIFMDWRHLSEILTAGNAVYDSLRNLCVWCKDNAGMGSFYRSQHELVFVFKKGDTPHINNFELGQHGRHRSNVWRYAGINSFSGRKGPEGDLLKLHPTVKPVELVADAILDCSLRDGVILDPFLGSGSSLIAAEKTGRRCFGIEIDPAYVDVALQRWENLTNRKAKKVSAAVASSIQEAVHVAG